MPSNPNDPQLGPALALVALRRDHPDLAPLLWTLYENGSLTANAYDQATFAAYQAVLGGDMFGPYRYKAKDGEEKVSRHLSSRWRDVPITLYGIFPAADYDSPAAAKAVA